jgi:hypothetical protein
VPGDLVLTIGEIDLSHDSLNIIPLSHTLRIKRTSKADLQGVLI